MKTKAIATLANGCFWCADTVFRNVEGVETLKSGFTGGVIRNPAYREVCTFDTGHVEAVQLTYNPQKISFKELLYIFFATHDPTSKDRQGYDAGPQYRSVIFYHTLAQKNTAEAVITELNNTLYDGKIVTQIKPSAPFYEAEEIHQNFYNKNPQVPYCSIVIDPKLAKLRKYFANKVKSVS